MIYDKRNKTCFLIEISVTNHANIQIKYVEKINNYKDVGHNNKCGASNNRDPRNNEDWNGIISKKYTRKNLH